MNEAFPSASEKLRRTLEQIGALDNEIRAAIASRRVECVVVLDPHMYGEPRPGCDFSLRTQKVEEAPIRWAVLLGEIAHNLHSALDHAFFALAQGPGVDDGKLYFPIRDLKKGYDSWRLPTKRSKDPMTHVDPCAIRIIESFQPYQATQRREDPKDDPLSILKRLSKSDKHRVNVPTVAGLISDGWASIQVWVDDPATEIIDKNWHWPLDTALDENTSLGALRTRDPTEPDKVHVSAQIPTAVFVERTRELVPTLQAIKERVLEAIAALGPFVS